MNDLLSQSTPDETIPLTNLLVTLGKTVLRNGNGLHAEWLDMEAAADLCKDHNITLGDKCPNAAELESAVRAHFQERDEIYAPGVNVVGSYRRVGWASLLMLRFYRYNPDLKSLTSDKPSAEPVPKLMEVQL